MGDKLVRAVRVITVGACVGSLIGVIPVRSQTVAAGIPESRVHVTAVTVDVDAANLEHVLRLIAHQAGLEFVSSEQISALPTRVTMHVKGVAASDAFAQALTGTGLKATIKGGLVVVVDDDARAATHGGEIVGAVTDGKSKQPLRGAMVFLDEAKKGVSTDRDGRFRLVNVAAGAHTIRVRLIGYGKATRATTVSDEQVATVNVTLDPSTNVLEQVVVTGTVIPTELKAIPTAITVITGKELEERGVKRIYELFRGDVPGLFINRGGEAEARNPGAIAIVSRGSTQFGGGGQDGNFEGIKTYVDGVELADKAFLGMIDPTSVDRVEILTGPQASTIYGSNAINGVIQIFTKRGAGVRPQLVLAVKSAWTQNSFGSGLAPNHHADASMSGTEGRISYNVGGSWEYEGSWIPSVLGETQSAFGGVRISTGKLTVDGSLKVMLGQNKSNGWGQQVVNILNSNGVAAAYGVLPNHSLTSNTDRLFSGSGTYVMTSWWSHTVTLGMDQLEMVRRTVVTPIYGTPADSGYARDRDEPNRLTAAYNTTVNIPLTPLAKVLVTLGADESHSTDHRVYGTRYAGTLSYEQNAYNYTETQSHEHGGFLQSQLGMWDALFITYGVRAVYNPNIGRNQNPNLEPRYGIAYSHDVAGVTAKVRASYGTATRPPYEGSKDEQKYPQYLWQNFLRYWGTNVSQLANPDLVPESQQGGEGGLELYFGNHASIQVTHYNQTVDHLIIGATVDSIDMLPVGKQQYPECAVPFTCSLRQSQRLNIGSVRNDGVEGHGTITVGALTVTGTYSWNKSRLIGITPRYRNQFPDFVVGSSFDEIPEHKYGIGVTYTNGKTRVTYNVQGQGLSHLNSSYTYLDRIANVARLGANNRLRMRIPSTYSEMTPRFYLSDLNAEQQLTRWLSGLLEIHNVANSFNTDISPTEAQPGRVTGIGFRARF